MRPVPLTLALVSLALASAATAAADKGEVMLSPADLDPASLLPAPPVAGSLQAQTELAELHAVQAARSEADFAAAAQDNATKNATIFAEVLGPAFDLGKLPATRAVLAVVRATEKDAADRGKAQFRRPRPWIVEPALKTCEHSDDEPLSSYPSGHTTMGYSMAGVLARLVPAKAPAIMARAAVYGQSRIVCEHHFRSDVTAGEALGLIVAERLMAKPDFQRLFAAAKDELTAAGI